MHVNSRLGFYNPDNATKLQGMTKQVTGLKHSRRRYLTMPFSPHRAQHDYDEAVNDLSTTPPTPQGVEGGSATTSAKYKR